jgi:hypothetical protein
MQTLHVFFEMSHLGFKITILLRVLAAALHRNDRL